MEKIRTHKDLRVFQLSFELAMGIFELSKSFPVEEKYSLTDQIRRSSRSVTANISEAFRKRRYPKSFVAKHSDTEGEPAETQVWLDFALKCKYISQEKHEDLNARYDNAIGMLVNMIISPENWSF
jgi:four helix bundle protein